jgi:hypothetical protein
MEYKIEVTFKADRVLTQEELAALQDTVALQIEEPADLTGQEADYRTREIDIKIGALL